MMNHITKAIISLVAASLMAGCASFPKTKDDYKGLLSSAGQKTKEFLVELPGKTKDLTKKMVEQVPTENQRISQALSTMKIKPPTELEFYCMDMSNGNDMFGGMDTMCEFENTNMHKSLADHIADQGFDPILYKYDGQSYSGGSWANRGRYRAGHITASLKPYVLNHAFYKDLKSE